MLRNRYVLFAWIAFLWAVANSVYVYLILGATRTFRVEAASYAFVAVLLPLIFWSPSGADVPGHAQRRAALTESDCRGFMLLALGLWLLVVAPCVALPFLGDDYVFLARYRHLPDVLRFGQFFRPAFAFVFFLLDRVGNGSTVPFHVAGFLLHAASAWCVYVLAGRLLGRTDLAAFCFAIFLMNPLQMETVLWASGLQELLWTFFVLAGLVACTREQILSWRSLVVTVALLACALLAKETALAAVLLVPAADWAFFRMKRGTWLALSYTAVALVLMGYLIVRVQFVAPIEPAFFVTPSRYFIQKFIATPYASFVQPWNLTATHIPSIILCGAAVLAFTVLFVAVVRGTGTMVLAGPAVIVMSTLPVYSYFFVGADLRAARYLYFAAIGWALLVTQLLTTLLVRRRQIVAAFTALTVALFLSLRMNVMPWRTAGDIAADV
jgi:hypothetical protein